jgi:hypothetical protein
LRRNWYRSLAVFHGRLPTVALLAVGEGQVPVLDHVPDLSLHRKDEKHEPVHQQNGPEDGDVEHGEKSHQETHKEGLDAVQPAMAMVRAQQGVSSARA